MNFYEHYTDFSLMYVEKNGYPIQIWVDNDFVDIIKQYRWSICGRYPATYINGRRVYMSRLLLSPPEGLQVDHINGNIYCFMRENLRVVRPSVNQWNAKVRKDNRLGIKGVRMTRSGKFEARLYHNGKYIHLGTFSTIEDAVVAHDEAISSLRDCFATTNIKRRR